MYVYPIIISTLLTLQLLIFSLIFFYFISIVCFRHDFLVFLSQKVGEYYLQIQHCTVPTCTVDGSIYLFLCTFYNKGIDYKIVNTIMTINNTLVFLTVNLPKLDLSKTEINDLITFQKM